MTGNNVCLGLLGLGHWGPNLLRNFAEMDQVHMKLVCDTDASKLAKAERLGISTTRDPSDVLSADNGIDAVVIATPVSTHFDLVRAALESGKHVFVEKPITACSAEADILADVATERGLTIMVGHIFLYNDGIRYVKGLIDSGQLGNINFIHGQRTNLGPVRKDVDALWDLAAHDISIFNYWLGARPETVTAHGSRFLGGHVDDVVHATYVYPGGTSCQILASWLHPSKVRQITVVGDHQMLVWDDMNAMEPIRIYDKSIGTLEHGEQVEGTFAEFQFTIRNGDVHIPQVRLRQPLLTECEAFINALLTNSTVESDARMGADVVRALVSADTSRLENSSLVTIEYEG